jgi:diketogulonate reductase-like aldo/keto reductase
VENRARRLALTAIGAAGLTAVLTAAAADAGLLMRPIPSTGERLPAVGLGTWLTFDVARDDAAELSRRAAVLQAFFAGGGRLVDSSPMYGRAEQLLGLLLGQFMPELRPWQPFCATKVWTASAAYGPLQMAQSLRLWGLPRADLMQVHNLLNAEAHLKTLRRWKDEGRTRYIGITTSHGRAHDEARGWLQRERLDFLQITYSPADRSAEGVMGQAAERGLAVIVNRPFDGGALLARLRGQPLPPVAAELGCETWAALVLKWELAHAAVTCVIPATTDPLHCAQNMRALSGPLPDGRQRAAIEAAIRRAPG